ncbi:MAG: TIGR04283 family arsenosugar biosynthesis glycosyltransferase [Caldilineaceae bacterium]|nr:TIGR04283 family arsenosugar biosynthesis glycosyltransferase [Caldilineaceae bacterium]
MRALETFSISAIIPAFNEARSLRACLDSLVQLPDSIEILLVDGGSSDSTCAIAESYPTVKVLTSARGRALQMNAGAAAAGGEIFWFIHADSIVPPSSLEAIAGAFRQDPGLIGGAFGFRLDTRGVAYRLLELGVLLRNRVFCIPYGDQAMFVSREVFFALGGFPEAPILEDLKFWRRLKKFGTVKILTPYVLTSARKWRTEGLFSTTLRHWMAVVLDWLGASPERISVLCRSRG